MIEAVRTVVRTGRRVTWDGTNPQEVRELAGDLFAGLWEELAGVTSPVTGHVTWMTPGWSLVIWDDGGPRTVSAPDTWALEVLPASPEGEAPVD